MPCVIKFEENPEKELNFKPDKTRELEHAQFPLMMYDSCEMKIKLTLLGKKGGTICLKKGRTR